jgi:hypothetical protein
MICPPDTGGKWLERSVQSARIIPRLRAAHGSGDVAYRRCLVLIGVAA